MNACTPSLVMLEATLQVANGGHSMTRTRFTLIVEDWTAQVLSRWGWETDRNAPTTSGQGNGQPCEKRKL